MAVAVQKSHLDIMAGRQWNCLQCGGINLCDYLPVVDAKEAHCATRPVVECTRCATTYTVEHSDGFDGLLEVETRQSEHKRATSKNTVSELDAARIAKNAQKRNDAARRVAVPDDNPILGAILKAEEAVALALEARSYAYFEANTLFSLRQLESALPTSLATIQRRVAEGRELHNALEIF